MVDTPKAREQAALYDRRRQIAERITSSETTFRENPLYAKDVFEPESYLSTTYGDPIFGEPLPSGRYADPRVPSPLSAVRADEIQEFRKNPSEYIEKNAQELNNEQSLLDRGKTFLGRLFDYRDEADLSVFNVNLSAVESTWDGFLRYMTGAYDLLNVGFGGLVSAAPGGVRTLSFDELSGGNTIGQVLSGEMEAGDAPSVGQIAITSIGKEAARIRNGEARLSDILLLNPATAPFILAGLAAEDSPVQDPLFDIMNQEMREEAFSKGWEKWMSGVTDAGLMFADPLIGAGVGIKVARAGMLGAPGGLRTAINTGGAADQGVDSTLSLIGQNLTQSEVVEQYKQVAMQRRQRAAAGDALADIKDGVPPEPIPVLSGLITEATDTSSLDGTIGGFIADVVRVKEDGTKVMPFEQIASRAEIEANPIGSAVAEALYNTKDPVIAGLIIKASAGTPGALDDLIAVQGALGDTIFRAQRVHFANMAKTEPAKVAEVSNTMNRIIDNTKQQMEVLEQRQRTLGGTDINLVDAANKDEWLRVEQQRLNLQATVDEAGELYEIVANGKIIDPLDYTSPLYNKDLAESILNDLHRQEDAITVALNKEIYRSQMAARMTFPAADNAYSRMVGKSRARRAEAKFQYKMEGTSILPRKRAVKEADGTVVLKSDGWFSPSEFSGVGRFRRNARVWRWMGTETPSGWIGLKGTSTVGAEREMTAALDLDIYKGSGVEITRTVQVPGGVPGETFQETVTIGGRQRREELFQEFASALNDPAKDPYKALLDIEAKVADDLGTLYNQPADRLADVVRTGKKFREQHMDNIRTRGYWVDEAGERHYAPWLEIHAANGTYMQNFQAMEKALKKQVGKDGGAALRATWDVSSHLAASAYQVFNDFWRPATLMRLSYTQRNVFEGMIRAMAYNASLAPLLWPVKATVNGTRNKVMRGSAGRKAKAARVAVDESEFGELIRREQAASTELGILERAMELQAKGDTEKMAYVLRRQPDGTFKPDRLSLPDYEKQLAAQRDLVDEIQAEMAANVGKLDAAVEGTAFGAWRKKELAEIDSALTAHQNKIDGIVEMLEQPDANGNLFAFDEAPAMIRQLGEISNEVVILKQKQAILRSDVQRSIAEYQSLAGRQKRIGSGTSIGPDGNYYNDAFTGPFEQINRALMSADNTIKQTLSLEYNVWESLFYRAMVKNNQPIAYSEATRDEWATAMVQVIDDLASSDIVQRLVNNGFDTEDALVWLRSPEGERFYQKLRPMFGDSVDNPASVADTAVPPAVYLDDPTDRAKKRQRLRPFAEEVEGPAGAKVTVFDAEIARAYVNDVANKVTIAMQQQEGFIQLLQRRIAEKQKTVRTAVDMEAPTPATGVDADAVKQVIDSLPEEARAALGYTMGDEIIQMGTRRVLDMWATGVNKVFKLLGQIPEDAVVRGPFYNQRFKATRNLLIEQYWAERGMEASQIAATRKKRAKAASGREEGVTLAHDEFQIPAKDLSQIEVLAHRQSLKDTREWMYTIERRTKLGKYGEWIFPFISATQNSTVTMGKLLYKEPWLAPFIADLWRAPQRLGIEDEEGNLQLPMPMEWVQKTIVDNPNIPFLGGVVDSADMIKIPKNGLNVIAPETGFGLVPRPSAWVQVAASELMKAQAFPTETPQVLKSALGDKTGDEVYQMLKDYVFGEEQGMSAAPLSGDKLLPAWTQKIIQSRQELSRQYGYQYQLHYHTQMARWRGGERDEAPTEDEIAKRTTNSFWFQFLGNMGIPTPITPYPILTRPLVETPVQVMQDTYMKYREADPLNANVNFDRQFGDWALEMANTKITRNVGGANPTPEVISDIRTFDSLIRQAAPLVGDDLGVLGIITNNRTSQVSYETSAYRWQTSQKIPGTNREWREVQSPEMSIAERQRITGWTVYRQFMDQLDAKLQNAGFSSYEVAGAVELKAAKTRFVENMMRNPEYAGWLVDFQDRGGQRAQSAVRVMELAISDDTFARELISTGNEQLYGIMREYVYYRRGIIEAVERTGNSINHQDNIALKTAWANMRQGWKNRNVRWAEIADLYLSSDDDPVSPGSFIGELALASGVGVE
jgi:hypothetical protein